MKIKKVLFVLMGLSLSALSLFASPRKYLTVELLTGDKYSFLIADNPVLTFDTGELVVNGNPTTSYSISGVKDYHFSFSSADAVDQLGSKEIRIVGVDEQTIKVLNVEPSSLVTLVSTAGQKIFSVNADASGVATVNLPTIKGVYVLSVSGKSFKIIRK